MEGLVTSGSAWNGRRVFVTGHTGFKGSWLSLCLNLMGARLFGYSLKPPTNPSLFDVASVRRAFEVSTIADVRDEKCLRQSLSAAEPEVVFHLAAQPLVRASYQDPLETFSTNVMGTVNLLEAVRHCSSVKAVVVVTTDKCYMEQEWPWPYRENDVLGGRDPYAASKACAELATACFRDGFDLTARGVGIATVRAGNVIGGGDWTHGRLIPDVLAALDTGHLVSIRNPRAVRPWQHVLDPLAGYLRLADRLLAEPNQTAGPWNFGPDAAGDYPVIEVMSRLVSLAHGGATSGDSADYKAFSSDGLHEAAYLRIDASKARQQLGWVGRLDLGEALALTWQWHKSWREGANMYAVTCSQIGEYFEARAPKPTQNEQHNELD